MIEMVKIEDKFTEDNIKYYCINVCQEEIDNRPDVIRLHSTETGEIVDFERSEKSIVRRCCDDDKINNLQERIYKMILDEGMTITEAKFMDYILKDKEWYKKNKTALATIIGCSRHSVINIMHKFQHHGVIGNEWDDHWMNEHVCWGKRVKKQKRVDKED